ncbi:hypothetical protein J3F83DRAFT_725488 [Trichoderma novae-zelandiae]
MHKRAQEQLSFILLTCSIIIFEPVAGSSSNQSGLVIAQAKGVVPNRVLGPCHGDVVWGTVSSLTPTQTKNQPGNLHVPKPTQPAIMYLRTLHTVKNRPQGP